MELKNRLRELRGDLSQRKCAEMLGVTVANYNKWEQGLGTPRLPMLIQIADYYNVSLDYLTGRVDYKNLNYQQSTIETGLTENALKGLAKIKESSEQNDVDILDALNFLLEKELESDVQKNLECLQDTAYLSYLFQSFSDCHYDNYPTSLSAILFYIAKSDRNIDDYFYAMTHNIRKLISEFPENNEADNMLKHILSLQTRDLDSVANALCEPAEYMIPSNLLPSLRKEYNRQNRQHQEYFYDKQELKVDNVKLKHLLEKYNLKAEYISTVFKLLQESGVTITNQITSIHVTTKTTNWIIKIHSVRPDSHTAYVALENYSENTNRRVSKLFNDITAEELVKYILDF